MKKKYENLEENSVCIHKFLDLKHYYKDSFETVTTITNINDIIHKRIGFISNNLKDNEAEFSKIDKYIMDGINLNFDIITHYINLIDEIVMYKDLEWDSNIDCSDSHELEELELR
jgi:hypothetical protein